MAGAVIRRVYLDANIFVYAIGGDSPYREPCRRVIDAMRRRLIAGETSVTTLEEVLHHRRRRGDSDAVARAREVATLCSTVHSVDRRLALAALEIAEVHRRLDTADAIHVATARAHGLTSIMTGDRDFDCVGDVERLDPLDRSAMASLLRA